jgi:cytochrome P450
MKASANPQHARTVHGVCARLGVPVADWSQLAQWTAELPDAAARHALDAYVDVMIADRCGRLADDLLSELIRTGVAGLDLTAEEIQLAVAAMLTLGLQAESSTPQT